MKPETYVAVAIGIVVVAMIAAIAFAWFVERTLDAVEHETDLDRKEDDAALDTIKGELEAQTWDQAYARRRVRAGEMHE